MNDMGNEHSYYSREEDRKWRERVDYEQIVIKTAQQSLTSQVEELQEQLEEIDDLLRGDPLNQADGLVEQVHAINVAISRLNSTVFVDSTGKRGLAHDVEILIGRKKDRDYRTQEGWKFWTAVLVACISTGGLILTNVWKDLKPLIPILNQAKATKATKQKEIKKAALKRKLIAPAPPSETSQPPLNP